MPSYECALSTVDQMMPEAHTPFWLIFKVDDPDSALQLAQQGLGRTVSQVPFLAGQISCDAADNYQAKLKWSDEDPKVTFEEVAAPGLPSYEEFEAQAFDMTRIPANVFPKSYLESFGAVSKPVLIASYIKLKGGLILMLGCHHNNFDAGAIETLVTVWASNTKGVVHPTIKVDPLEPLSREQRLVELFRASKGLSKNPEGEQAILPQMNPAFKFDPDAKPSGPMQTVAPVFRLSVRKLESLRLALRKHTRKDFTLDTTVISIVYVAWRRAHVTCLEKSGETTEEPWTLNMSIGMRRFLEQAGFLGKHAFFGCLTSAVHPRPVLPYVNQSETFQLESELAGQPTLCQQAVPATIDMITEAIAGVTPWKLSSPYVHLKDVLETPDFDHRRARPWGSANDIPFTPNNWAGFDMLPDFGPGLARPQAVRTWVAGAPSGICMSLPRHRAAATSAELRDRFDIMLSAEKEEIEMIEKDEMLKLVLA